eukprot:Plantae.Rhodophyta-Hildenbrandia_rubra.ctg11401.p1 GENE.Plantae.Rhodophyta-Hildenbrandia_rubra.ctg11401~~Plantae.Rhodophyta-Hildenbrandia_rubra.ctg11401.p1  ORF type:complete len:246 (-),score=49.70 Plantae.Rhodophyta-Hildenbrandia_rubra.ctg11401:175-912(-)
MLTKVPNYKPTIAIRATHANLLRQTGEVQRGVELLENVLSELPEDSDDADEDLPDKNNLLYDYAAGLLVLKKFEKALETAMEIKTEDSYHLRIKLELLEMLTKNLRIVDDPAQERALRAFLELRPDHGKSLWNLGAFLCRKGKLAEGTEYYMRAIKSGTGLSDMELQKIQSDLDNGQAQLRQQGNFPSTTTAQDGSASKPNLVFCMPIYRRTAPNPAETESLATTETESGPDVTGIAAAGTDSSS